MNETASDRHKYPTLIDLIGNTPIVELKNCVPKSEHQFLGKIEYMNPGGSVKDRMALAIIEDGEKSGALVRGSTIIEATSGNTGVGLAMIAATRGYKCIFVMPDKISEEKRATLRALGARVVITPTGVEPEDPRSYMSVAQKFVEITPKSFYANQYHNPVNPKKHEATTGPEIWEQTQGKIDIFVAGAGTGGTISGVGKYLKSKNPKIKIVLADPVGSILHDLYYYKEIREKPASYLVEGIGEDMLPDNVHLAVFDDVVRVTDAESFQMARTIAETEGILVGPSCGSAFAAAVKYSKTLTSPARILTLFPDGGRAYLSKAYNEVWLREKGLIPSVLAQFQVKDLVAKRVQNESEASQVSISDRSSLREAARLMRQNGLLRVRLMMNGATQGVVAADDILSWLADGRLKPEDPALHLLKSAAASVSLSSSLHDLRKHFEMHDFVQIEKSQDYIFKQELADFVAQLEA
jgi:cystathionine beta-synthase